MKHPFDLFLSNHKKSEGTIFGDSDCCLTSGEAIKLINNISYLINSYLEDLDGEVGIAICLPRTNKYLASIFAIWQTGNYFIPLNDRWPEDYLQTILEKARPKLVISENIIDGWLTLQLDKSKEEYVPESSQFNRWNLLRNKAKVAYVIFTSGSTGDQKGVVISLISYMAYIEWCRIFFYEYTNLKSLLITAELTFDITLGDIAFALAHNTEIHVSPDPRNILWHVKLLIDRKIDVFYSVPSTITRMFEWVKSRHDTNIDFLRLIISGGDSFVPDLITLVKNMAPLSHFYNVYGPTEVTINCFAVRIDNIYEEIIMNNVVPIGKPFKHLSAKLYNENEDCFSDKIGELVVAGNQCMDGYIYDSDLTNEVFLHKGNVKYYRTGDLAEKNKKGRFSIIGRIGNITKVKGYRVNTLEIDNVILRHQHVAESKTIVIKDKNQIDMIASCVVISDGYINITNDIYIYCKNILPDYMVPKLISVIPEIPTGKSGKYDDKQLADILNSENT